MDILTLPSTLNNFLFPQLQRRFFPVSAYVIRGDDVAHAPHASSAWPDWLASSLGSDEHAMDTNSAHRKEAFKSTLEDIFWCDLRQDSSKE